MSNHTPPQTKPAMLNGHTYDTLKFAAQIALPAFATLYFALSQIWGFAKGEEIVGTITAFDAFLGVFLSISSASYNNSDTKYDGSIDVTTQPDESKTFSLVLHSDPYDLEKKDTVTFKVKS